MILISDIDIDYLNNIYVINDNGVYNVAAYDSSGSMRWYNSAIAPAPPFGDIGLRVLVDYNFDVWAIGLNDSIFKYGSDGHLIWARSMNNLDNYLLSAQFTGYDWLVVAGAQNGIAGYDVKVTVFDRFGNEFWIGSYNSNLTQEFPVDMAIDASGIYVLEDSISSCTIMKFDYPINFGPIDYSLICVDSVWYEPSDPTFINVRIFNGNSSHLNYPSVQIVSPTGDTISNVTNFVNFFAQIGNTVQTYTDTIIIPGITDFTIYHFAMSEGFGDTTVEIPLCFTMGIDDIDAEGIYIYPNPATNEISFSNLNPGRKMEVQIFDNNMKLCSASFISDGNEKVNVSQLSSGIYIVKLISDKKVRHFKLVRD
jgi:hypothetical protein